MANVVKTKLVITSTDTDYEIPGDWSVDQVKANYASSIQGLGNMSHTETLVQSLDGAGQVRVITFSPRTGTKG